jgi:SAM-dependent methyltransferase
MDETPDRLASTRRLWSSGDYATVGDLFAAAGATLVERVGVDGLDVLDVATGTGNTARAAARAGAARVVGVDATPELLAEAVRRSAEDGYDIEWVEGDIEALTLADAGFDRVVSSFGAMFAADQGHMGAELVRVCRPGGRVGLTAWAVGGLFDRMTILLMGFLPAPLPDAPSPRDWASGAGLERIFAGLPVRLTLDEHTVSVGFPSPEAAIELFETRAPPIMAARAALEAGGRWAEAREALVGLFRESAEDDGDGCRLGLDYVVATFDVAG